jgi:hypothetical protein
MLFNFEEMMEKLLCFYRSDTTNIYTRRRTVAVKKNLNIGELGVLESTEQFIDSLNPV